MPEGVRAHQDANTDSLGHRGQPGEERPGFEIRPCRPTWLNQVVAVPGAVEAERVEELPAFDERWPGQVLVGDDPEAHLSLTIPNGGTWPVSSNRTESRAS